MSVVLLTNYYSDKIKKIIYEVIPSGFNVIFADKDLNKSILKAVELADYLLVGGRFRIDENLINLGKKIKMVQRTGVGLDSIDLTALRQRNIPLYVNKGVNSQSVAEHTVMLILSLLKNLVKVNKVTKSGVWFKHELGVDNYELRGKKVGLIGFGAIGRQVVKLLKCFNVKIVYYDIMRLDPIEEKRYEVEYSSLDKLLNTSDIISIHCPLSKETTNMIDKREFDILKKGSFLVNTSRGKIISEEALVYALDKGIIRGVALDVHAHEPIEINSPLLDYEQVILTPHIAGITYESFKQMMFLAFKNIEHFDRKEFELIKQYKYQ